MNRSRGNSERGNYHGRCQSRGGNWLRGRGKFFNSYGRGNWSKNQNNYQQTGSRHIASSQSSFSQSTLDVYCPYKGWKLYFADEHYSDASSTTAKVKLFEAYIKAHNFFFKREEIETKRSFPVDAKDLLLDEDLKENWSSLETDIIEMPEKILNCLGLAIHQVFSEILEEDLKAQHAFAMQEMDIDTPEPLELADNVPVIHAQLFNIEPITPLKNLKANLYGKFVTIKGTVVRVGNVKPLCTKMAFECNTCGEEQVVNLPDGKYILPTRCSSSECRGRTFNPQRSSHLTETVDWQKIRVQEIIVDDMREAGRIPRIVECELTNDLVDCCVPGDIIVISGIVKVTSSDEGIKKSNQDKCMFLLYIFANSVVNNKGKKTSDESSCGINMEFSTIDYYAIQEIQADPNLFKLLVVSLCPAIYGHEMVKAGLILGLFGGSQKFANDRHHIPIRGDPHILIVGDPGLGKSQMLQSVANIAPRGVYVCGNTTTTSGLTVTLTKEGSGCDCALEAGALVLADQGCCCIDEFDKMGNQHQALLEAMEQQCISIAKAGIVCSLPARTSILAAANPVGGHYNRAKTVSENLKLGSALLSRFDLVFILMDKPDEDIDSLLTEHVMALHSGRKKSQSKSIRNTQEQMSEADEARSQWESDRPLSERLKTTRGEAIDPIPPQLLRKYVAYSRMYVRPKLSQDAAKVLQDFYLDLRKRHQTMDSTPITTRQLESMIRLSEARARLELRETVSEQDAKDIVEITKYSMVDTYCDGLGNLDFLRLQHGSGMSSRGQAKKFISVLSRVAEQTHNSIFTMEQMQQIARDTKIQVANFNDFISSLNNQNYLIKKGPKIFQLLSTNF